MQIYFRILPELLKHFAVFFFLTYLFKYVLIKKMQINPRTEIILNGMLFAGIAIIGMILRIDLGDGHFIDGRMILVGISAAYVHPIAGIISALLVSLFRFSLGGSGVLIGIIGICGGAVVGIIYYTAKKKNPKTYSILQLLLFGIILTIQAQIWIPVLYPWVVAVSLFERVSLVGLISYPAGTLIIGLILNTRFQIKKCNKTIEEGEKQLRQIIENTPLPMVVLDKKSNIRFVNNCFTRSFGYTEDEIAKTEMWWEICFPDEKYRKYVQRSWIEAINNVLVPKDGIETFEWELTNKDGSIRLCEFYIAPFEDSILTILIDITNRRATERELKKNQMHYNDFINISSDIVSYWKLPPNCRTDLPIEEQIEKFYEAVVVDANMASVRNFGFCKKEDIIGKPLLYLVKKRAQDITFMEFIKNNYNLDNYESNMIDHKGDIYHGLDTWDGIVENGILTYVWTTSKNITEQKKVEEKLERKNIVLSELIEQISVEKRKILEDTNSFLLSNVYPIIREMENFDHAAHYADRLIHSFNTLQKGHLNNSDLLHSLSRREIEICNLIREGIQNKEIAELLGISNSTVERHRARIREKLRLTNTKTNLESFLKIQH